MIKRIFDLLQVDYLQFRILLKIHVKLDFRSQQQKSTTQVNTKKYRFFLSLIFYLIPSLIIAIFCVERSNLFGFSFLTIALSMIFIALAIIIEFNEIILNPDDSEILSFRPISSRTYFWVKMANLLFYVTLIGLALNIPPAFVGLAFAETSWTFPLVYFCVGWITQVTVASFVIILYTFLVKIFNFERLKDILAYVQVIFTFIIFVGYQFLIRLTSHIEATIELEASWNFFTPPAWFGSILTIIYSESSLSLFFMAGLAVLFTVITILFAFRNLSLDYAYLIYKISESARLKEKDEVRKEKSTRFSFNIKSWLVKNKYEQFGYDIVSKYLRRSRTLRTRIYPSFAMPLVIMGFFILDGDFQDPFLPGVGFTSLMPFLFLVWVAVFFYQLIPTSDDWKASWIYHVIPIESYAKIHWGSVKAVLLKYITPYFIFVFAVLSFLMPIWHAFLACLFNFVFFICYYIFMTFFLRNLPLSKKYERGQSNTRFMMMFVLFPIFALGAPLEYLVFQHPIFLPFGFLILIIVGVVSAKVSGKRLNERIQKSECFF